MRDDYKEKLQKEIERTCLTILIGALSRAEECFDGPEEPQTNAEMELCDKFENFRKSLLDFGNSKIRLVPKLLSKYEIGGKKFRYDFEVRG